MPVPGTTYDRPGPGHGPWPVGRFAREPYLGTGLPLGPFNFEEGTNGSSATSKPVNGVALYGGQSAWFYDTASAFFGSLGMRSFNASAQMWWRVPNYSFSVSVYALASQQTDLVTSPTSGILQGRKADDGTVPTRVRLNGATGHIEITGVATTAIASSTITIAVNDPFRLDATFNYSNPASAVVTVEIFVRSNVQGTVPDETVTSPAFSTFAGAGTGPPDLLALTSSVNWEWNYDTLRIADGLVFLGPYGGSASSLVRSVADSAPATDLDVPSQGTNLTRSQSDSAPATDTQARVLATARSVSDSAPATDTDARAGGYPRSESDSAPATDVTTRSAQPLARSLSDAAGGTDSTARASAYARADADSAAATDADGVALGKTRSTADSSPATDADTRTAAHPRPLADTAAGSDTVAQLNARSRSASDTAPAVDADARVIGAPRAAADSAPALDALARVGGHPRSLADSAPAADSSLHTIGRASVTNDTASATDVDARTGGYPRALTNTAAAVDTTSGSSAGNLNRSLSDTAAGTDTTSRAAGHPRSGSDAAAATDTSTRGTGGSRSQSDAAAGSDTTGRAGGHGRSTADSAPASDATNRSSSAWVRSLTETASASDLASAARAYARQVLDAMPAVDTLVARIGNSDVEILGFNEHPQLQVTYAETTRDVTFAEVARVTFTPTQTEIPFDQEAVLRLSKDGVERYQPGPTTSPAIDPALWEASFDDGLTWVPAEVVNGAPTWLVAGHAATSPGDATVLPDTAWVVPALRFPNGDELVVRDESFHGDEQPPTIHLTD